MAPEIFKRTGHGKPVDVWAMGVITYFLLAGYTPFDRDTQEAEMKAIIAGTCVPAYPSSFLLSLFLFYSLPSSPSVFPTSSPSFGPSVSFHGKDVMLTMNTK